MQQKSLFFITILLFSSCGIVTKTRYGNGLKWNVEIFQKAEKEKGFEENHAKKAEKKSFFLENLEIDKKKIIKIDIVEKFEISIKEKKILNLKANSIKKRNNILLKTKSNYKNQEFKTNDLRLKKLFTILAILVLLFLVFLYLDSIITLNAGSFSGLMLLFFLVGGLFISLILISLILILINIILVKKLINIIKNWNTVALRVKIWTFIMYLITLILSIFSGIFIKDFLK